MRIARFMLQDRVFYGELRGDAVYPVEGAPFDGLAFTGEKLSLAEVRLLAPCTPSKVVCVGKNYRDHVAEMADGTADVPEAPLLFIKPSTCVIGPGEEIIYPACSERVDHEAELGVVIGKTAHNIAAGTAQDYIFGYTCLNDVTARDIQKREGQWTRGKAFDTFCPIGPWIETALDAQHTGLRSRLNGKLRQDSNTANMIHSIDKLLCVMSECMTLLPGDVVATGTPAGIGPMQRGDVIEVEIDGIGTLVNTLR
ncbi:MAG: fumarylacetoacetate hydrolase family protein [Eubacteriales bacterium]|nr:fumarylacetoacetate hydrolase family protein [Eubacteriales bacterium]